MTILLVSFFAGILTVLAPCVLPLLPIILWASIEDDKDKYRPYIIIFSLSISIIIFSLLLKATTLLIWFDKAILTTVSWIIIMFFWFITLFPDLWKKFSTKIGFAWKSNEWLWKSATKKWVLWSVLIWFSLWPVFSSCSPTYAIILAVILPVSFLFWLINLFAYVLWLAVVLLVIALLWQKFTWKLRWISDPKSKFKKVLWIIFLLVWLAILTWFDKIVESKLIDKWFIWWSFIEQNFLDKIEWEIDSLDDNNINMKKTDSNIIDIKYETAYFAWGCFWCIESIMDAHEWVIEAISWYAWWTEQNPTYELISTWNTQYRESVKVIFDPNIITYTELVEIFFRQIDPIDDWWQFADRWFQYTTAIYTIDENQKDIAEIVIKNLNNSWKFDKVVATKIEDFTTFWEAEEYHQDYAQKQSTRYKLYKKWSWREDYIKDNWENDKSSLKEKLTDLQFQVTQNNWTERPFDNEYWDNKQDWIYVDIVDWTPLFSSLDKYDSWSGWPAFTRPIDEAIVDEKEDNSLFSSRTEIRSKNADSHLWHVFTDWPSDKWWLRYCINSAALRFVPLNKLKEEWYEKYIELFN